MLQRTLSAYRIRYAADLMRLMIAGPVWGLCCDQGHTEGWPSPRAHRMFVQRDRTPTGAPTQP